MTDEFAWAQTVIDQLSVLDIQAARAALESAPREASEWSLGRARAAVALAEGDWRTSAACLRGLLESAPTSALDWQNLSAALAVGAQWALSRDAALQALSIAPQLPIGWLQLFAAEEALDLPADGSVLAEAIGVHAHAPAVLAAAFDRLSRVTMHADLVAEACFAIRQDLAVIELARTRPALAEIGLRAAVRADQNDAVLQLAQVVRQSDPTHAMASAALLELAVINGLYDDALSVGVGLLASNPPAYITWLIAFAMHASGDAHAALLQDTLVADGQTGARLDALSLRLGWPIPPSSRPSFAAFALFDRALEGRRFAVCMAAIDFAANATPAGQRAHLWACVARFFAEMSQPIFGLSALVVAQTLDPAAVSSDLVAYLEAQANP